MVSQLESTGVAVSFPLLLRNLTERTCQVVASKVTRATRAELLRRLGCSEKSRAACDRAIESASNSAESAYLRRRRDQLR
jgi:predicted RNA polymerase sigma factor